MHTKRQAGFSLLEMLVATAVMVIIVGATLSTLTNAMHATEAVTLMADTQENLRAGLDWMVRDISQAGDGIPQGGITIPNTGGATPTSAIAWPGKGGNFPSAWTTLPGVAPGAGLGPTTNTSGQATDMVTVLYADNTLQDANNNWLSKYPIKIAATTTPAFAGCAGSIAIAGSTTTITFDTNCINISGSNNTGLNPGDLILLQSNASNCSNDNSIVASLNCDTSDISAGNSGMGLGYVSTVSTGANSITFSPGDPFGLNATGAAAGTVAKALSGCPAACPTTTATRIWMITYYLDNTNPLLPQLMREVNFNGPEPVSQSIENLQLFYDILTPAATPPVTPEVENPTLAQLSDIRDAYIVLYARSNSKYSQNTQYFRNNLTTVVSIRGLNFYNQFNP
jgi:prepilin-type N-terminal cleavage/methylation domain-containing protein